MSKIVWGEGARTYDAGISRGVVYLGEEVLPWNGLISVGEKPESEIETVIYFDGQVVSVLYSLGDYESDISAFTYPAELMGIAVFDGFSYRTSHGGSYRLHIVYGCTFTPGAYRHSTVGAAVDVEPFDFTVNGRPAKSKQVKPSAHLVLDSATAPLQVAAIERLLYGSTTKDPYLPALDEIIDVYEKAALVVVTYLGDGSYKIQAPQEYLQVLEDGSFVIDAPTAQLISDGAFTVASYGEG